MRAVIAASAAPSVTRRQHQVRQRAGPGHRQPAQLHGKHDRQQRAQPEVRHRHAGQRQRHGGVVDRRVPRKSAASTPSGTATTIATTIAASASSARRAQALARSRGATGVL